MEQVAKVFAIGTPIFLFLVLAEKLYGYLRKNDTVPWMDAISGCYSGFTNLIKSLLGFTIVIVSYEYLYKNLAVIHIETTWLAYILAFVALDFKYYWSHRWTHGINLLWNKHVIHHSSEEYNIASGLRQSIAEYVNVFFFLGIPAAIVGISPMVMAIVLPFHVFAQLWYHTRQIGKLGFLEKIIVTPSHHRVHHALNPIYLDKNHGAIFIIWDKLFGTFQEELDNEPPVYGVTRPANTYNPIRVCLNFGKGYRSIYFWV